MKQYTFTKCYVRVNQNINQQMEIKKKKSFKIFSMLQEQTKRKQISLKDKDCK